MPALVLEVLLEAAAPFVEMSDDLGVFIESGTAILQDMKQWVIWLKHAGMPMPPEQKPLGALDIAQSQ